MHASIMTKSKIKKILISILAWIGLLLIVLWSIFPTVFVFTSAFKDPNEIFSYPPSFIGTFSFKNFVTLALKWPEFFKGMLNSVTVVIGSVLITLMVSCPAAFAYSRIRNRYVKFSGFFVVAARMFPPIVITIPFYPIFRKLGLIDNQVTLVLLYSAFYLSVGTWILKNFIDNVPIECEESAYLDGCTKIQSFFRITLPLVSSGIVTVSILVAIFAWKEFLFAFLFTTYDAVTSPVVLHEMLGSMHGVSWGPLFAASATQLFPIFIFIILVQGYLMRGVSFGTEK